MFKVWNNIGKLYMTSNANNISELVKEILRHQEKMTYCPRTLIDYKYLNGKLSITYQGNTEADHTIEYLVR